MNYYQPSYTLVAKEKTKVLDTMLGVYQRALMQALELESISDGAYTSVKSEALDVMYAHEKTIAHEAMLHASAILDMFNVMTRTDYRLQQDMIVKWFGNCIRIKGVEYVTHLGQWYKREWRQAALKKPKHKLGVVYLRDFSGDHDTTGLAIALPNGKTQMLVNGGKMEKRSNAIRNEQNKFIRNLREQEMDAAVAERIRQHTYTVDSRYKVVRTEHINATVAEILEHAHTVILCGPVTYPDENFYRKNGIQELLEHLELTAAMFRGVSNGVVISKFDARFMKPIYENSSPNGHAEVARQVLAIHKGLLDLAEKL